MADMKLFLQILANASGLKREMGESRTAVSRFAQGAKHELDALKGALGSIEGKLAGLGISIGVVQQLSQSAHLDKGLTQLRQTAGESQQMVKGLRKEFFLMASETGQGVEGLKEGFDSLIQSGQSWKAALESTKGINIASAVTGAPGKTLAGGLTVGATAFNIDLEKPGKALDLLDKMTVAGRLGNAELENLSDIFARVGVNAASAGMGYDKTLAFIEGLSMVERQPERLATLSDSTLRLFTNLRYMAEAQKGTGVKFFDAKGGRRDAVEVLQDIKKKWDVLKTDKARAIFIQRAFGKADLDTIKGMKTLLSGDALSKIGDFTRQIGGAGGTLKQDLPDAISNAIDQTGRLKGALREAADEFAQPVNKALSDFIKFSMDKKSNGGLELSGKEMLGYGVGGVIGTALLARYGGKGIGALAGKLLAKGGSTAIGVAEGKALQAAAGVTPVFVTNWPGGGFPGSNTLPGNFNPKEWGGGTLRNMGEVLAGSGAGTAAKKGFGWLAKMGGMGVAAAELAPIFGTAAAGLAGGYGIGTLLNRGMGAVRGWSSGGKYKGEGWAGEEIYDLLHPEAKTSGNGRSQLKNDIKIDVHFDELGRAITKVNSMNTRTDVKSLNRGSIWDALMTTEGM